jgi:hypothetical protein
MHVAASFKGATLPLEQGMHDVDPLKLVRPASQGMQLFRSLLPFVPLGHGFDSWQIMLAPCLLQFVLCQPSEMSTDAAPPAEMVPSVGAWHVFLPFSV